ncbi:MAG: hypothetical protein AAF354_12415 [Pseudomonadota bacterium]
MPESLSIHREFQNRLLVNPPVRHTISVVTQRGRRQTPNVEFSVSLCKRMDWGAP